jgi:hypothetical protein
VRVRVDHASAPAGLEEPAFCLCPPTGSCGETLVVLERFRRGIDRSRLPIDATSVPCVSRPAKENHHTRRFRAARAGARPPTMQADPECSGQCGRECRCDPDAVARGHVPRFVGVVSATPGRVGTA